MIHQGLDDQKARISSYASAIYVDESVAGLAWILTLAIPNDRTNCFSKGGLTIEDASDNTVLVRGGLGNASGDEVSGDERDEEAVTAVNGEGSAVCTVLSSSVSPLDWLDTVAMSSDSGRWEGMSPALMFEIVAKFD